MKDVIVQVMNWNLNQSVNENQFTTQSMIAYKKRITLKLAIPLEKGTNQTIQKVASRKELVVKINLLLLFISKILIIQQGINHL